MEGEKLVDENSLVPPAGTVKVKIFGESGERWVLAG